MFNGALSAIVTPFRDGEVDEHALRELIEWQIQSGVDGLVPCGSTGESATLPPSANEKTDAWYYGTLVRLAERLRDIERLPEWARMYAESLADLGDTVAQAEDVMPQGVFFDNRGRRGRV